MNGKKKSLLLLIYFFVLQQLLGISTVAANTKDGDNSARYVYVLVAPFMTITDDISFSTLSNVWEGADEPEFPAAGLLILPQNKNGLISVFGCKPSLQVHEITEEDILQKAMEDNQWAILPFEMLEPRWKVIAIDDNSPVRNDFDLDAWGLTEKIGRERLDWSNVPATNRDPSKLTSLILTGVTAMVRGTANYMDAVGAAYPASKIREPLIAADILHVNNEVPFAKKCNQTEEDYAQLRFCSKTRYLDLLIDIGVDVIELDGDHFQDFGDDAVLYTLELYRQAGIPYYGGGENLADAQKPLEISHNGNRFVFIGCNGKEIGYAVASETRPGAIHCDMDLIEKQIREYRKNGFIPIVTFQHLEVYQIQPVEPMKADFQRALKAGAVIVSGSQSHIPMSFEAGIDTFVHYGLGNLFFDQAFLLPETSEALIDRYAIYDGKLINIEFLTIKFTNLALSRFMTTEERVSVLKRIFDASSILSKDETLKRKDKINVGNNK